MLHTHKLDPRDTQAVQGGKGSSRRPVFIDTVRRRQPSSQKPEMTKPLEEASKGPKFGELSLGSAVEIPHQIKKV